MDFRRLIIIFGLAISSYLLFLAWNEDYGQNSKPNAPIEPLTSESLSSQEAGPAFLDSDIETKTLNESKPILSDDVINPNQTSTQREMDAPQASVSQIPEIKLMEKESSSGNSLIYVTTDVLKVAIDLVGGEIKEVALPAYPAS